MLVSAFSRHSVVLALVSCHSRRKGQARPDTDHLSPESRHHSRSLPLSSVRLNLTPLQPLDFSPASTDITSFSPTQIVPPTIHAVLNATKSPKRGAPRKAFVCTFGLVAGPSHAPLTSAEKEGKGKENETVESEELGKWDVLVRREVAGKPVTVFDVR